MDRPAEILTIRVEASAAPEMAPFLGRMERRCREWYPQVEALLHTPGFTPPREVVLRGVPHLGPSGTIPGTPGVTSGTVISLAADWVAQHPDDAGLVLHELTHVVQSYPRGEPWWVTEGIADWVRYQRVETWDERRTPRLDGAHWTNGYAVTAAFLAWAEDATGAAVVGTLNAAMRRGAYHDRIWQDLTGEDIARLWAGFTAARQVP